MLVSQLLKLPKRSFLLSREIKNTNILVGVVILITVIPSVYLGITLVRKEKFVKSAGVFVTEVCDWEGNYLLKDEVNGDLRTIKLAYVGNEISKASQKRLKERAKKMGLPDAVITIEQGFQTDLEESDRDHQKQLDRLQSEVVNVRESMKVNQDKLDSLATQPTLGKDLLKEISAILPQIKGCSITTEPYFTMDSDEDSSIPSVFFAIDDEVSESEKEGIERWLVQKLGSDYIILNFRHL